MAMVAADDPAAELAALRAELQQHQRRLDSLEEPRRARPDALPQSFGGAGLQRSVKGDQVTVRGQFQIRF